MADQHWTFIVVAYAVSAALIVAEVVSLVRRRRRALDRANAERDHDEDERDA
ncbi:MAG TPA: heme exporter protein CcmD [Burkholderiaceae bacterium]|nr:heme exporter protein CcmD [Burkholderiaceae bacterium]